MINTYYLELPLSRTNFHDSKGVFTVYQVVVVLASVPMIDTVFLCNSQSAVRRAVPSRQVLLVLNIFFSLSCLSPYIKNFIICRRCYSVDNVVS